MAAHVLRNSAGNVQILEPVLPAVTVASGLGKQVREPWHTRSKVASQGNFSRTNRVRAAKVITSRSAQPEVVDHARLPFTVFPTKGYHAENDELVTGCRIPAVVDAGLFFRPVKFLDEGIVHLPVPCVEVFHARWFDFASFQTRIVRKDGGKGLEAILGLEPPI